MTIKMRLDTQSLRDLLEANPDLEIEIGKEVINNIKDDLIKRGIDNKIDEQLKGLMVNTGTSWNPKWVAKDPRIKEAIEVVIRSTAHEKLGEAIDRLVSERVNSLIMAERTRLALEIKANVAAAITPEIAREVLLAVLNK